MEHGIIAGGALLGKYLQKSNLDKYNRAERYEIQKELHIKPPTMWDTGRIVTIAIQLCSPPHQWYMKLGIPQGKFY